MRSCLKKRRSDIVCTPLSLLLLLTTLILTACSESSYTDNYESTECDEREITVSFDISLRGDLKTRSGRELWSSAGMQQVNTLSVYMFYAESKEEKKRFLKAIPIPESDFNYSTPTFEEPHRKYEIKENLADGRYSFLALGFESKEHEEIFDFPEPEAGKTTLDDMVVRLKEGVGKCEEFFACVSPEYIIGDSNGRLDASIVLNRVPAGVLAYFKHIPFYRNPDNTKEGRVTRLAVEIASKGVAFGLNEFSPLEQSSPHDYIELLSFKLLHKNGDGTNKIKKEIGNNWYDIAPDNWLAEGLEEAPANVEKEEDSILGGLFLLPFYCISGKPTMRVVIYAEKGTNGEEEKWKSFDVVCTDERGRKDFDIMANHFYGLGEKYSDSRQSPRDPDDPDSDKPDEPIDLSEVLDRPEIYITVIGAWQEDVYIEM